MTLASRTAIRSFPIGKAAEWIAAGIASLAASVQARLNQAQAENELRALSDDLLADVGLQRSAIERPRPGTEVDAALMRRLMSMS